MAAKVKDNGLTMANAIIECAVEERKATRASMMTGKTAQQSSECVKQKLQEKKAR